MLLITDMGFDLFHTIIFWVHFIVTLDLFMFFIFSFFILVFFF